MSVSVLLVDDQELIRTGFRMILEAHDIEVLGEANDGREALALARSLQPDVILMDIRMPNMDGLEATRALTTDEETRDIKVLILTTFDHDEYVYEALRCGASGFLLKDVPKDQLVEGIKVIAAGDALLAPSVTRRLIDEYASRARRQVASDLLDVLTAREKEVLDPVALGMSNAEIAAHLVVGESTVKTHVAHMLMKLNVRDRVQAVVLAYETGLVAPGWQ